MKTRYDILNAEAGPLLDLVIAEKVMGYRWYSWTDNSLGTISGLRPANSFNYIAMKYYEGTTIEYFSPEPYSTDISAAWKVLDMMRAREFRYVLNSGFGGSKTMFAAFDNQDWADSNPLYKAGAETMPLAICRAALLAVTELPS